MWAECGEGSPDGQGGEPRHDTEEQMAFQPQRVGFGNHSTKGGKQTDEVEIPAESSRCGAEGGFPQKLAVTSTVWVMTKGRPSHISKGGGPAIKGHL